MTLLNAFAYVSILIFFVAVIRRGIRIANSPVHLRWELYPVPHEKGRAHYGGSRLEEVNHWEKKSEKDHLGEAKVMIPEILFLKGVWEHNKNLWTGSFPFHFGLYLFFAIIILSILGAFILTQNAELSGFAFLLSEVIYYLAIIASAIGIIGSIRMFFLRMVDVGLSRFASPSHFFNIILIGAMYITCMGWALTTPNFSNEISSFYLGLITFSSVGDISAWGLANIWVSLLFVVYLPFTHMTHFFTKYFTYHQIRWEDSSVEPGSKMSKKLFEQLNQPVTWAAPHIGADGQKTWLAIATSAPVKIKKEENNND